MMLGSSIGQRFEEIKSCPVWILAWPTAVETVFEVVKKFDWQFAVTLTRLTAVSLLEAVLRREVTKGSQITPW